MASSTPAHPKCVSVSPALAALPPYPDMKEVTPDGMADLPHDAPRLTANG